MIQTLAMRLGGAVRRGWLTLAIVADDDGLEMDLMPAAYARPETSPLRSAVPVFAHNDA